MELSRFGTYIIYAINSFFIRIFLNRLDHRNFVTGTSVISYALVMILGLGSLESLLIMSVRSSKDLDF